MEAQYGGTESTYSPAGEHDPLVNLGLVDPKTGAARPSDDWQPSGEAQEASQTPDWDSSDNPYKQRVDAIESGAPDPQLTRQQADLHIRELQGHMPAATHWLVNEAPENMRMSPAVAQAFVASEFRARAAEVESMTLKTAMLPAAKNIAAESIAKEFSKGGVEISAKELADARSVDAMRERASTLAKTRRDGSFQSRRQAGTDRAEGGPPQTTNVPAAIEKLSSFSKIALGLRRGQT